MSSHPRSVNPKVCRSCDVEKPATEFHAQPMNRDGLQSYCKDCNKARVNTSRADPTEAQKEAKRAAQNEWYHANQPAVRAAADKQRLVQRYGITRDDYDALLASQGGCCAICGSAESKGRSERFAVDHDHSTGVVRGLLCVPCNTSLGILERPEWLASAQTYLLVNGSIINEEPSMAHLLYSPELLAREEAGEFSLPKTVDPEVPPQRGDVWQVGDLMVEVFDITVQVLDRPPSAPLGVEPRAQATIHLKERT